MVQLRICSSSEDMHSRRSSQSAAVLSPPPGFTPGLVLTPETLPAPELDEPSRRSLQVGREAASSSPVQTDANAEGGASVNTALEESIRSLDMSSVASSTDHCCLEAADETASSSPREAKRSLSRIGARRVQIRPLTKPSSPSCSSPLEGGGLVDDEGIHI